MLCEARQVGGMSTETAARSFEDLAVCKGKSGVADELSVDMSL